MRGATLREYAATLVDDKCRRCHITQEEHAPLKGNLQLHHVRAIRDGGHPTDRSNLQTLCYFCHREWHTFWERPKDLASPLPWPAFMSSPPYWHVVKQMVVSQRGRIAEPKVGCCRRCGKTEAPCCKIRPFQRERNGLRHPMNCLCYWCQREWEIYWQSLRPVVAHRVVAAAASGRRVEGAVYGEHTLTPSGAPFVVHMPLTTRLTV